MYKKKTAVMIYPFFSMQEISCLTAALTVYYGQDIDVFASNQEPVRSEDGFQVVANKTFDEFDRAEYDCLVLPGIIDPLPALFDKNNIEFLRQFAGTDFLIAAISSSPILLAKAGLLQDTKYTCGLFQEVVDSLDFIPKGNQVHIPLCHDKNIITAIGFAFREFAVETLKALGIDCREDLFRSKAADPAEQNRIYHMGEENFREFTEEYNRYLAADKPY